MSHTIKEVRVEIGYEANEGDALCNVEPPMLKVLEAHIGKANLVKWSEPTDVAVTDPWTEDEWVARHLAKLFGETGNVCRPEVANEHLAFLSQSFRTPSGSTGAPGTHCRLVIDKQGNKTWVNSRSYVLRTGNTEWPTDSAKPNGAYVFATVSGRCWPKS